VQTKRLAIIGIAVSLTAFGCGVASAMSASNSTFEACGYRHVALGATAVQEPSGRLVVPVSGIFTGDNGDDYVRWVDDGHAGLWERVVVFEVDSGMAAIDLPNTVAKAGRQVLIGFDRTPPGPPQCDHI